MVEKTEDERKRGRGLLIFEEDNMCHKTFEQRLEFLNVSVRLCWNFGGFELRWN